MKQKEKFHFFAKNQIDYYLIIFFLKKIKKKYIKFKFKKFKIIIIKNIKKF